MTMPVIINSITQFVGGTNDEWLSLDSILPNKMTVIALDTGYVKRGDGTKTYAQLSVLFNINDIVDIGIQLQGKADRVHEHEIAAVIGLVDALSGKAPTVHSHTLAQLPEVQGALSQKADSAATTAALNTKLGKTEAVSISQLPPTLQIVATSGVAVTRGRLYNVA